MRIPSFGLALTLLLAGLAAADEPATVDNPLYQHWSKFKVGTSVKLDIESTSGGQTQKTSMTTKLVEVTKEKVTIEVATAFSIPGVEIPPQTAKQDIEAKVPKPPEMPKEDKDTPKPETKEGEETVEVLGRKIKCKTIETKYEAAGMKVSSKMWTSEEVPGFVVKSETKSEGEGMPATVMKQTLVEWKSA